MHTGRNFSEKYKLHKRQSLSKETVADDKV